MIAAVGAGISNLVAAPNVPMTMAPRCLAHWLNDHADTASGGVITMVSPRFTGRCADAIARLSGRGPSSRGLALVDAAAA